MVKLVVLYNQPTDPAAFDEHYFSIHGPLAEKIPGLQKLEVAKLGSIDGSPSPYYLQAELYFESSETLQAGMASEEGRAAGADVANFATGGAIMLTGQVTG